MASLHGARLRFQKNIKTGSYKINLQLLQDGKILSTIPFTVKVLNRRLSLSDNFHLNFWQQPYAVSRYYGVAPWSQAHLDILRPYMQLLARAGQRNALAILFYEPWGEQSNDKFDAMIETTRKADGTWSYDYTASTVGFRSSTLVVSMGTQLFLKWCLGDMTFTYYDEASKSYRN